MNIAERTQKYQEFKIKYLGKNVDFDKVYGPQCVDLAKQYVKECYGVVLGAFGGDAYRGYLNGVKTFDKRFKQVPYKPGDVPTIGDIGFYKPTRGNPYGHVFIIGIGSNPEKMVLLEQNYVPGNSPHFGKGTGEARITERTRNYKDFVGVWRFMG